MPKYRGCEAVQNMRKIKIMALLHESPKTIKEIYDELDIFQSMSTIQKDIKLLIEAGDVIRKLKEHNAGGPVPFIYEKVKKENKENAN